MGAIMTSRQAAELDFAFERNGFNAQDVKKLSEGDFLTQVREVLYGRAKIGPIVINCDETPFIPQRWSILPENEQLPNRIRGLYKLDITEVMLHLSKKQKDGINGSDLNKELEKVFVLPANVLDFLLKEENQHLIPEEWKDKYVFFWGTIYRSHGGRLCVRCLCCLSNRWCWRDLWFDCMWSGGDLSVVTSAS